jgi:hypothetical protein
MSTWTDGTPVDSAEDLLRSLTGDAQSSANKGAAQRIPMKLYLWIIKWRPDQKKITDVTDGHYRDLCRWFGDAEPNGLAEVLHRVIAAAAKDLDRKAPFYAQGLRNLVPAPYNTKTE